MDENRKKWLLLRITSIVLFFAVFLMLFYTMLHSDDNYTAIEFEGKRFGNSIFYEYDGKLYALIPSGGYYLVEDADLSTFRLLNPGEYYDTHVGVDKNDVYFGNTKIKDLDPKSVRAIGKGYYSDGKNSYFCSVLSERNPDLSVLMEAFQIIQYTFSKDKKPQAYIYPYQKLDTEKTIKPFNSMIFFATDGTQIYYKGKALENADKETLKAVSETGEYFCDKTNVYYQNTLLPIKNTGDLTLVSVSQGDDFLYDRKNGEVFHGTYRLDEKSAPYEVIGNNSAHSYNLIFVARDGVYFYNSKTKKQEKIGENDFKGKIKHLTDTVFCDDENMYFLHAFETFSRTKSNGQKLYSKNTEVVYFDQKEGWKKIKDIGLGTFGSVWTKNGKYYYFDSLGNEQLVNDTVFEIIDKDALTELLSDADQINVDRLRELIDQKKMQALSGEVQLTATVRYGLPKYSYLLFIVLVLVLRKGIRVYRKKKAEQVYTRGDSLDEGKMTVSQSFNPILNAYDKALLLLQQKSDRLDKMDWHTSEEAEKIMAGYDEIQNELMTLIQTTAQYCPCHEKLNSAIIQLALWSGCAEEIERGERFCEDLLSSQLITEEQEQLYLDNVNRRQG